MKKRESSHAFVKYFISVVTILIVALGVYRVNHSYEQNLEKQTVIRELEAEIEKERERTLELEKQYDSLGDREYIEKLGRDKFGLIYPDEILIEVEN